MKSIAVLFSLLALSPAFAGGPGVTGRSQPAARGPAGRRAIAVRELPPAPQPAYRLEAVPLDSGWVVLDSLSMRTLIPAGKRVALVFDHNTHSLRDTFVTDYLTDLGRQAVALAPDWLKDDLTDNFRRLGPTVQDRFAPLVIDCPDKRYYDEICFELAHLSPATFATVDPQVLLDNVEQAYETDRDLAYVDIVDYGDPLAGGNYYSTTRYRTLVGTDTAWVEIPRDAYYWWVIMPKGTDELPQYVYNEFWRQYLFNSADSGYPLLRDYLTRTRLFWDGQTHSWTGPILDTMPAVAVVGRWCALTMPFPADSVRPIQPNQIAHGHHGNCGEMQDLMWGAARTALLPCGGVLDINEDHVWDEIWWDGAMQPFADDPTTYIKTGYVAYDYKYGGGKNCSGIWDWRADGLQTSVTASYSDVCTLTVEVRDSGLRPVDGALVKLSSEDWYGGMADEFYGATDRNGRYSTELGDWQNYYLSIESPLGYVSAGMIIDSAGDIPGTHFFYACTLAGHMDSLRVGTDSLIPAGDYRLDVRYSADHEVLYGIDCYNSYGSDQYALREEPGALDLFVLRERELGDYLAGRSFRAAAAFENITAGSYTRLDAPLDENWYAVLSNEEQENLTEFADFTAVLSRRPVGVAERPPEPAPRAWARVGPVPFRDRLEIELAAARPRDASVQVLDRSGRTVRTLDVPGRAGACTVAWDGSDHGGKALAAGVYFCRVSGGGRAATWPVVFLGGAK